MARLFHAGAEIDGAPIFSNNIGADGASFGFGTITRDTAVFRSGVASWKFDSTAGNSSAPVSLFTVSLVNSTSYFMRGYFRVAAAPGVAVVMMDVGSSVIAAQLRTDGALELSVAGAVRGSPSASIVDSSWYRVELKATVGTGAFTAAELLLDGVSVATWSGSAVLGANPNTCSIGWAAAPGASKILNVDDVALNDSTGATNNSYPGDGKVVLLKPTADSAVGTGWTLGTGTAISGNTGKTAVSNTPPLGVADVAAGSDVKQIRNATSNANVNYDATMTTYTAAGVGASDTVNAVIPWVATAAPVTTSSKQGTVGVVSNPAIANVALAAGGTTGAFWSSAAAATYGQGWKWSPGTVANAPSVTLGTAPVMRITQVTASTRIAMVCGMFIYVDYTPAVAAAAAIPDVGMALTVT